MITDKCACGCGTEIKYKSLSPSDLKRRGNKRFCRGHQNKGLKHSPEHRLASTHKLSNNGRWKGGRVLDRDGYIKIKNPSHPFARKCGYILEHRLIMERLLNRFLKPEEIVHHKGIRYKGIKNRSDNRPENLQLFNKTGEHTLIEHLGKIYNCIKPKVHFVCPRCGKDFYKNQSTAQTTKVIYCSWACRYP